MLLLGYIISEVKYRDLEETIVKIVKSEDDCVLKIPKLIIGLQNAKDYAEKHHLLFDILTNQFDDGTMWTFKKTEKREYYERDIELFKKYIIKSISNDIDYYYINIYKLKYTKLKDLYNILFHNKLNRKINYIIIDNEMLYYALCGTKVMGICFNHLKYIGIDKDKIIEKIKAEETNKLYFTTTKLMWKLKDWFKGIEYVIPSILTNNFKN